MQQLICDTMIYVVLIGIGMPFAVGGRDASWEEHL